MKIINFIFKDGRIFFLIAGIVCLGLLGYFVKKEIQNGMFRYWDTYSDNVVMKDKTHITITDSNTEMTHSTSVLEILNQIDNGNIEEALQDIDTIKESLNNGKIKNYLVKFRLYEKHPKMMQAKHFFTDMENMKETLKNECVLNEQQAKAFAQIIPFYILKTHEKKTKNTHNLCDIFLDFDTRDYHITKKGAIVLCLAVRTQYERYGKKEQQLKDLQEKIIMYQQKYPSEIAKEPKNPKYIDEINYLDSFYEFLKYKIEKPDKLFKKIEHFFTSNTYNKKIKGLGE